MLLTRILYQDVTERVGVLKENKDVMSLFSEVQTDFDLDPVETFSEKYLKSDLIDCDFGLHGYIDYYSVDTEKKGSYYM